MEKGEGTQKYYILKYGDGGGEIELVKKCRVLAKLTLKKIAFVGRRREIFSDFFFQWTCFLVILDVFPPNTFCLNQGGGTYYSIFLNIRNRFDP